MSLTQEYYSIVFGSEKLSCFWETSVYSHLWTIKLSMRKAADLNIMQQTHLFPRVEFCWVQVAYQANWNLVTTHTVGKWLVSADRGVNTTGKRIYAILWVQKPIWTSDTCVCVLTGLYRSRSKPSCFSPCEERAFPGVSFPTVSARELR